MYFIILYFILLNYNYIHIRIVFILNCSNQQEFIECQPIHQDTCIHIAVYTPHELHS